jgi:hypothetical protein
MIKFRRGSTQSWRDTGLKLGPGQPGYDKDKHKIKIGDGEKLWPELPYASGLFAEEILCSEAEAKNRDKNDKFATNIITYGTETPNEKTVGQIYLQQLDEPEVDYIIESGVIGIWTYQKWKSGIAKCWGNYSFTTTVQEPLELFYRSAITGGIEYPLTFVYVPTETATMQSSGGQVLLANSSANTHEISGGYAIISLAGEIADANYRISIQVEGFWRAIDGNKD